MAVLGNLGKIVVVAAGLALLAACGSDETSGTNMNVQTNTQGQELLDLKAALDAGAISQEEYEEQRQKILNPE